MKVGSSRTDTVGGEWNWDRDGPLAAGSSCQLGRQRRRVADGVACPKAYSSNKHDLMMFSYRGSNRSCVDRRERSGRDNMGPR